MYTYFVGIGSNLGDRLQNIRQAVTLIKSQCKIIALASIYETEPYGYLEQNNFYNTIIQINSDKTPQMLLQFLLNIEHDMGRIREKKWGPRIIDLDIILADDLKIDSESLKIPHPDFKNRNFVLIPLQEIAGDFKLIDFKCTVNQLIQNTNLSNEIKKIYSDWY